MTGSWGLDRTGKKYLDRIEPDESIGMFDELIGNGVVDSAVKWLSTQRCPKSVDRPVMLH
jgi:hypothetical protein